MKQHLGIDQPAVVYSFFLHCRGADDAISRRQIQHNVRAGFYYGMNDALDFYPLPVLRPRHHLRAAHSRRCRWHVRFTDRLDLGLVDDWREVSGPDHAFNVNHSSRVNGQYGFRRNRNKNASARVTDKKRTVPWIDVRVVVRHYGADVNWILARRILR